MQKKLPPSLFLFNPSESVTDGRTLKNSLTVLDHGKLKCFFRYVNGFFRGCTFFLILARRLYFWSEDTGHQSHTN